MGERERKGRGGEVSTLRPLAAETSWQWRLANNAYTKLTSKLCHNYNNKFAIVDIHTCTIMTACTQDFTAVVIII